LASTSRRAPLGGERGRAYADARRSVHGGHYLE
jgi:hypothetical protein